MSRYVLHFVLSCFCLSSALGWSGELVKKDGAKGKKHSPRYTVGKDTTFITTPRDKDGIVDHGAALNAILGKGVTAETNAVVLLYKAIGPKPEGAPMPKRFFTLMGIEPPPEKGEYYLDLFNFARERLKLDTMARQKELLEQMDAARAAPWTAPQFPILAKWLDANADVLMIVTEACQRPHYYSPLVALRNETEREVLVATLLPGVQKCRELCNVLVTRTMLRMAEGKYEEAWQDLLTCHRLGRLVARGGTLIEGLVGIAIDQIASHADLVFLDRAKLSAQKAQICLRDLEALPPMPAFVEKIHFAERFMLLDLAVMADRHGIDKVREFGTLFSLGDLSFLPRSILDDVDWDPALKRVNRWYDRLVAALREKDRRKRAKSITAIHRDIAAVREKLTNPTDLLGLIDDKKITKQQRGEFMADAMVSVMFPSFEKVAQAWDRNVQTERNLRIAFALAAYRSDHGRYPERLDALSRKYIKEVPLDLFTGNALQYHTAEGAYLLYSFGPNEMDDRGRWYDDDPPGDDPRVRMPLPVKR